ncbi:MAG: alpha/beta fold hydrolase [Candidatus Hermodarchaeota archaeon]
MNRKYMRNETFENTFPFKPNFKTINGFEMHFVDEGKGQPIICLHGMPTWGYLYRNFIKTLSNNYRVIVPDQMGFGKSDVPQNKKYLLNQHINNTTQLIIDLDLKDITLVVQDWGGPIGLGFAVDYPERVKRLVIMNTSIGVMKEGSKPWYYAMEKKGKYTEFIKNIAGLIQMGIYNKKEITSTMLDAYTAPFPNDESFIGALAWPKDIPIGNSHPSAATMLHIRQNLKILNDKQKILIWGMKDPIFAPWMTNWWNKIFPGINTYKLDKASHFLQEDSPAEIINIIQEFLGKT